MNAEQKYIEFLGLQHLDKVMKDKVYTPLWRVKTTQIEYIICLVEGAKYELMYFDGENDATYGLCLLKRFSETETDTDVLKWVLGDISLNNITTQGNVEILEIERFEGIDLETFEYKEVFKLFQKQ